VKDQRLFDLPISKYDKLSAVEEKLNFISLVYEIFKQYKTKMDEIKNKIWKELNTKDLRELSEVIPKLIRRLRGKNYEHEPQ